MDIVYRCKNTRQCYWLCEGHGGGGLVDIPWQIGYPPQLLGFLTDSPQGRLNGVHKLFNLIRNLIPKEALEEERKAMEYGSQQSII